MKPSKSLLVIDDDKGFCASVRDFFRDREFTTVTVQSGREGLDWCTANRAEVILLDQKLPDCEGAQLCAPLLAKCGEAKIIFITAYPSLDHAVQALRRGAHDYLSKPMELMELQLAVDRAFRTAQLERVEQLQQLHTHRESRHSIMIGESGGLLGIARLVELAAA
ncbi:MAG: Two component, sigma54 specific, transcriptional regulator, Fis family, partial [uncultured bacterium]